MKKSSGMGNRGDGVKEEMERHRLESWRCGVTPRFLWYGGASFGDDNPGSV